MCLFYGLLIPQQVPDFLITAKKKYCRRYIVDILCTVRAYREHQQKKSICTVITVWTIGLIFRSLVKKL
jgi:hypothetical protein